MLLYNSRDIKYKKPFGAVSTAQRVFIVFPVKHEFYAEKVYIVLRLHAEIRRMGLNKTGTADGYDIFSLDFEVETPGTYYYRFEIEKAGALHFAGRGFNGEAVLRDWMPEWQLSVYDERYKVPDNQEGGIIYHIFADRFCNKNNKNKPVLGVMKKWNEDVTIIDGDGVYRANDFYGGNFEGIESKLDYLKELGVTMIYLSPVFESHSNHRYDTGDYTKTDSLLGNENDFGRLINSAKEYGISVMLDGVFNHTGADSIYFNKFNNYPSLGAYQSRQSPYYEWFTFSDYPEKYDCWWGITVVPTVSRHCTAFQSFIAGENGIIDKWTKLGVKGWRLDVVDELSTQFVEKIRRAVKKADKNALVVGEVWEDASTKYSYGEERSYFRGFELDGVMNYVFKDAIIQYVNGGDAAAFLETVMTVCENYPLHALLNSMTLLGSHDTCRIINRLADINLPLNSKQERKEYRLTKEQFEIAKRKLFTASCLQYFLPGIPTVYYGDEIGMQGFEDPLNRRPFGFDNFDEEILKHYQKLGELRKKYHASFKTVGRMHADGGVFSVSSGELTLITNLSGKPFSLDGEYENYLTGVHSRFVQPGVPFIYRTARPG